MQTTTRPRSRIVDVARHAGVSAQTVSNVINRRGGYSGDTRSTVEAAIAALDFQPNRYAQSLRSRRTGLIGFDVVSGQLDASNPFTLSLLGALVHAARAQGRRVLVFAHDGDDATFRATATEGLVDGFVLSDCTLRDPRVAALEEFGIPCVAFGRPHRRPTPWAVDIDNALAMRQAVEHVLDQGCRDIAFVGYDGPDHWNADRRRGALEALADNGIRVPRHRQLTGRSLTTLRKRLPQFVTDHGVPEAVITSSDSIAVAVLGVAAAHGIRVGTDLAVTGFDDGPLATMVSPEITSVAVPVGAVAEHLLDLLARALDGRPLPPPTALRTHLTVRASSGFRRGPGQESR